MKLTIKNIYDLHEGLGVLGEKELPVSTSFKIQKNISKVGDEYVTAEKLRSKLIEKYKEKDLGNGQVKIMEDKIEVFNKEIGELMAQEVDVDLKPINLSELNSITIKPKTLVLLDKIFKEGEQNEHGNKKQK